MPARPPFSFPLKLAAREGEGAGRLRVLLSPLAPGLALALMVTALALLLPGGGVMSPMILAIVIGMLFRTLVGTPRRARAGLAFAQKRLLRLAIVLLGLQLTAGQLVAVGAGGIAVIAASLIGCFVFTTWLGRRMGIERDLVQLIAAGSSICGASAVMATSAVSTARDEDVTYAMAAVTVFGALLMLVYPLLPGLLGLDARAYGLWAGASIHEVAQVVAAGYQQGQAAGDFAVVAKLGRVMMLAPMVIAIAALAARRGHGGGHGSFCSVPVPWFAVGFLLVVAVNSLIAIPDDIRDPLAGATRFLLVLALAAMGLETDLGKLWAKGLRPLGLAAAAALFIAVFSLMLITIGGLGA